VATFKDAAYRILKAEGRPMSVAEITRIARDNGWLETGGRTPEATMGAALYVDVNEKGPRSRFVRGAEPSSFALNPAFGDVGPTRAATEYPVRRDLSSIQKGDLIEARVADLITLYARSPVSCFRPLTDDDGIDLIIKPKGSLDRPVFLQVKSRFGIKDGPFTSAFKPPTQSGTNFAFVFCLFDLDDGDLSLVWFVPTKILVSIVPVATDGLMHFVSGLKRRDNNSWNDYLVDKRGLGNKVLDLMLNE
jgi:hypothetical protein